VPLPGAVGLARLHHPVGPPNGGDRGQLPLFRGLKWLLHSCRSRDAGAWNVWAS
jgi:hypothetical protein